MAGNKIINIQIYFLWGGMKVKQRKIKWVAWASIYRPKKKGGLGVKYCRRFNVALLNRWHWRMLIETYSLWHDLLSFRHGDLKSNILDPSSIVKSKKDSIWWRDLCSLSNLNWISSSINHKLGNGNLEKFWNFKWLGSSPFCA